MPVAVFTQVTSIKAFDIVTVDVRNGFYCFLMSSLGSLAKIDIDNEILTWTSTPLTPTVPM